MSEPTFTLTEEQSTSISSTIDWICGHEGHKGKPKILTLGGYAGTGKTTIIKEVERHFYNMESEKEDDITRRAREEDVAICAFTGKAVSVLRKKGLHSAQTLHSLMYVAEKDASGKLIFHKRWRLGDGRVGLVIVDEASMISTDLYRDLTSFGTKVLYVGDHGQLEPVGDNPRLMLTPDLTLTKIHRQAELSPIISLSIKAREGKRFGLSTQPGCTVLMKKQVDPLLTQVDQVLCAYNRTRTKFNHQIRGMKGFNKSTVNIGEKIIVLKNDREKGVFNGLILWVEQIREQTPDAILVDLKDDLGNVLPELWLWLPPLRGEPWELEQLPEECVLCDYGYAITVHKSQGSEWDSVLVYEEYCPKWSMERWRYTAITRAAKELYYAI